MKRTVATGPSLAILLGLLVMGGCKESPEKTYKIKLDRPAKVGDKFRFSCSVENREDMVMSTGRREKKEATEFSAEASGVIEVLAVDAQGKETKAALTLEKCEKIDGDKRTALVPKGMVVIVEAAGEELTVTAKDPGEGLSPEAVHALKELSPVQPSMSQTTDDEIFGTPELKKIGDSWPVNCEKAAADLANMFPGVTKDNFVGSVTLRGLTKVDGTECLNLEIEMTIKDVPIPIPPVMKIETSQGRVNIRAAVPVDPAMSMQSGEMRMTMNVTAKGVPGTTAEGGDIDMKMEQRKTIQIVPLKE